MIRSHTLQNSPWSFADFTPNKTQYLTHGYHRYPAKFIPQLVSSLIQEYSEPGDRICDPLGGCGTTLVEAKLAGRTSFGFDINPVAVLITQAKTRAIFPERLSRRYAHLCEDLEGGLGTPSQIKKNGLNLDRLLYWFGNSNLNQLISLKHRLEQEKEMPIRRFFLCALSHVLKNCSYWLTKSTKPQKDPDKTPEAPIKVFRLHTSRMMDRNRAFFEELKKRGHEEVAAIMRKADAKRLPLTDNCMDLIITSPPYGISYEYADMHQLTALLFGYCTSLSEFRQNFIGSLNLNPSQYENSLCLKALETVRSLRLADTTLAKAVLKYFLDMKQVYKEIHRVLGKHRMACIVIGDTELRGVPIPNTEIAIDLMVETGFMLKRVIDRPVPGRVLVPYRNRKDGRFSSSKNPTAKKVYSHEHIIVMRKK
jgi:DNA modification methylase